MAKLWQWLPELLIRKLNPAKVLCLTIGVLCWHEMDLGTGLSPLLNRNLFNCEILYGEGD